MRVPSFTNVALALAATAAGLAMFAGAQPPDPAKPAGEAKPVTVASFSKPLPTGYLGVPLGTVVRVTGEAFDGNETRAKADQGKTLLRIATVNGQPLAEPAVFTFLRAPDAVKKPVPGDTFDYYVHEYGEFNGIVVPPKELGIDRPMNAGLGFGYHPHLAVHASNAPRK